MLRESRKIELIISRVNVKFSNRSLNLIHEIVKKRDIKIIGENRMLFKLDYFNLRKYLGITKLKIIPLKPLNIN
jgi:hypothetical protein